MSPMWTINFHLEVDKTILIEILSVATITSKKSFFFVSRNLDSDLKMTRKKTNIYVSYKHALIFILKTP